MATKNDDLLSAGKLAKEIGISAAKVKKAIEALDLQPDNVRCGCKYYSKDRIPEIKKAAGS